MASRWPETRLVGSLVAGAGHGPCATIARISPSVNDGSSPAMPAIASSASAPKAAAFAPTFVPNCTGYHSPVTVKSDKWIRRMAAKGMIEPFEAGQIKEHPRENVVCQGASSYRYDIRCSAGIKNLTHITSPIVEP